MVEFENALGWLRAAGEGTRLRLLALCAARELSVTELTQIIGQSQPRVSRHLKVLCEAGLLGRVREGASVFYGLPQAGRGAEAARAILALVPGDDRTVALDRERFGDVATARREAAARYFRDNARQWDVIRSLHVDETEVERALAALCQPPTGADLLDIGTGTGRILALLGSRFRRAVGVDLSREMLAVARANLDRDGLRHCVVRQADMYNLPHGAGSFDVVTVHQVLHFADDPTRVIAEAARVLRPDGTLLVADFAPHDLEYLREQHAHRRLGFSDQQVRDWFARAGLELDETVHLPGKPLTVAVWRARVRSGVGARPAEAAA